ncbi:hypothetical protein V7O66_13765 [Methanolobus sp. ZRKC3]|uniref:hypothetical protein n=1 Tax=Methanolobus sp. ZRKC3 TaxID=3125786 RepID=UPI0032537D58
MYGNEIVALRGPNHKVFAHADDPSKQIMQIHAKPIHYKNIASGIMEDIDLSFQDNGKDMISSKNMVSVGFRKDGNPQKYMGIRAHNDHGQQFELSIYSATINSIILPLAGFRKVSLDTIEQCIINHELSDNVGFHTQVHEAFVQTAIKTEYPVSDFSISFEVHLTGWNCINEYDDGSNSYIENEYGRFVFVSSDGTKLWFERPSMWTDNEHMARGIDHRLEVSGKKFIYSKTANDMGRKWLQTANAPFFIDASIHYADTRDGMSYIANALSWTTIRDQATPSAAFNDIVNNGNSAEAKYAAPFYALYRSWFWFDTSAVTGTVDSVSLFLYGYGLADSDVCAMKSIQDDVLANWTMTAFTGSEYGHVTWALSQYNEIVFNSTGISDINTSGDTKVCIREYTHDYLNSSPTTRYANGCYYSDNTGTDYDPYLEIVISTGVTEDALYMGFVIV